MVFGLTFCLASFDWIVSLEPEWYSTIFRVYNFAGVLASRLAVLADASPGSHRRSVLTGSEEKRLPLSGWEVTGEGEVGPHLA